MKWRVLLEQDSETGDWAVWCPELPGCASSGETEDEALENIREAIELSLNPDPIDVRTSRCSHARGDGLMGNRLRRMTAREVERSTERPWFRINLAERQPSQVAALNQTTSAHRARASRSYFANWDTAGDSKAPKFPSRMDVVISRSLSSALVV